MEHGPTGGGVPQSTGGGNDLLYWSSAVGSAFDVYNNFAYNHTSYPTTKGSMKSFSDFNGRPMSKQASKFFARSGFVKFLGNLATGLMLSQSIKNYYDGDRTIINFADGIVGFTGLTNAALIEWGSAVGLSGSAAIGPFVAIYGAMRLMYDSASFNTRQNIQRGIDPCWELRIMKQ
ncbi:hypothetical protein DSECCO2_625490 [anaerobic digester metagenome]